jgi:hypothetical protein
VYHRAVTIPGLGQVIGRHAVRRSQNVRTATTCRDRESSAMSPQVNNANDSRSSRRSGGATLKKLGDGPPPDPHAAWRSTSPVCREAVASPPLADRRESNSVVAGIKPMKGLCRPANGNGSTWPLVMLARCFRGLNYWIC